MRENTISIKIDRPVSEVFLFTTDPANTHRWIESITEEVAEQYPPVIGTKYKNRGKSDEWDEYEVIEFEEGKVFTLAAIGSGYHVRYTYRIIGPERTELTYHEWDENGEVDNPFTQDVLEKLKNIMEER